MMCCVQAGIPSVTGRVPPRPLSRRPKKGVDSLTFAIQHVSYSTPSCSTHCALPVFSSTSRSTRLAPSERFSR